MKLSLKLTVLFSALLFIILTYVVGLSFVNAEKLLTNEIVDKLDAIASLQKHRIDVIINQNLETLDLFTSRLQLRIELAKYNLEGNSESLLFINESIHTAKSAVPSFRNIHILNLNGKVLASTNNDLIGKSFVNEEFFLKGKVDNQAGIPYLDKNKNLGIILSGPLILEGKTIGVAVIESSAENILSITTDFTGLGKTGEVFLIKNEKLFRDTLDYRGKKVLSSTRHIEKVEWQMVVKIDEDEALSSIRLLKEIVTIITIISALFMAMFILVASKSISEPITKLANVANEISEGKISSVIDTEIKNLKNEIGDLARSFDRTIVSLKLAMLRTSNIRKVGKSKKTK